MSTTEKDDAYSVLALHSKRSRDEALDVLNGEKKVKTDAKGEVPSEDTVLEVRVLISNYEAGVVIGKGGSNVKTIREKSSAFISILKSEGEAKDRVMNVKGTVDHCSTALSLIMQLLLEDKQQRDIKEAEQAGTTAPKTDTYCLKMLAHKFLTGCIIGKAGQIVKQIATEIGARVQVSSETMPGSTEKTVSITGTPIAIHQALLRILSQIRENPVRPGGSTALFVPGRFVFSATPGATAAPFYPGATTPYAADPSMAAAYGLEYDPLTAAAAAYAPYPTASLGPETTQKIAIPTVCAGSVIGKGGTIIADIKAQSGCQIRIADPEPTNPSERVVTVIGTALGIQTAVYLIRQRVEQPSSSYGHFDGAESTQKIAIPTICAGAVIGKGGTIIADIKSQSGCQIRIADPEPTTPNERVVTVSGSPAGIQTAVYLIRQRVEQPYSQYVGLYTLPQEDPTKDIPKDLTAETL